MTKSEMANELELLKKQLEVATRALTFIDETTTDKAASEDARIALKKIEEMGN